ncbi:sulfatase-like hydrolase/transferase [Paenibacillus sp. PL2-23]|uniref:sulfatase-like hydrolase/transferase n=1 Tax=Paenibacillus sp. PL2-23 TaxID=2100729 RepID=UPI0030F4D2DA
MNQPHIVLITTDQMRGDLLGCAGHPVIRTPHMDFLARRGVRFTQAYSTTPVCIPARATIMTGLEGHSLGITSYREGFELPTTQTLPQLLRDTGYETRAVGKMHLYPERCHYGFDSMLLCEEGRPFGAGSGRIRGYDDYEQWLAEQGYPGQAFAHGVASNEYGSIAPWHLPDHLHPTEWVAHESCKAIKRRDWTRPLFLWTSFTAPHPPLTPLMQDLYLYERDEIPKPVMGDWAEDHSLYHQRNVAQYGGDIMTPRQTELARLAFYAMITHVDRAMNRIIGTLREEGMLDNTWFIFTSDHGDNMGDHRLWFKSNFTKGACTIPFIITPPIRGDVGKVMGEDWLPGLNHSPVGLQDILPTCLSIAGVPIPEGLDGRSLNQLVKNPSGRVREHVLGEFGIAGQRSFMISDGLWKYIWFEEDGEELLFHIAEDPDELSNRAKTDTELALRWRNRLTQALAGRDQDPAVEEGKLKAAGAARQLSDVEKARLINDQNVRGLH